MKTWFSCWAERMGHTLDSAAIALNVSRRSVAIYKAGKNARTGMLMPLGAAMRKRCENLETEKAKFLERQ